MPRRPSQFHGFVGQKDRLSHANRLLQGAKARGQPFPHTLLNGPSGCGKTKLAQAFAAEYDTTCIEAHGQDDRPTLCSKIQKLDACDVLFIDEAHGLDKDAHELLYGVIDNFVIPTWANRSANLPGTEPEPPILVKPCSIILATDQPGKLRDALLKRMPLTVWLRPYTKAEMREIVDRMSSDEDLLLKAHAANRIAEVADGIPRKAKHHIEQLAMFYADHEHQALTLQDIRRYLDSAGIDADGLGPEHHYYMKLLNGCTKASINSMSLSLQMDPKWVRQEIEASLLRRGLIRIAPGGRTLTETGADWIKKHTTIDGSKDDGHH